MEKLKRFIDEIDWIKSNFVNMNEKIEFAHQRLVKHNKAQSHDEFSQSNYYRQLSAIHHPSRYFSFFQEFQSDNLKIQRH